jgi:Uma2 family endonuclease
MSSATLPPPTKLERETAAKPRNQEAPGIVIADADWATYERFLTAIGDRPLRCTYDSGRLEIMAPMRLHERERRLSSSIVERTAFLAKLPYEPCGSMTIRRQDLDRGFEPDECAYIRNAARMLQNREPDFTVDPPPDLAIEIDLTSSSIDRLALYAKMGIPELWRYVDGAFQFLHLQTDRTYAVRDVSLNFPFLPVAELNRFIDMVGTVHHLEILEQYEQWLRQQLVQGPGVSGKTV